jgi:hypothetical protein
LLSLSIGLLPDSIMVPLDIFGCFFLLVRFPRCIPIVCVEKVKEIYRCCWCGDRLSEFWTRLSLRDAGNSETTPTYNKTQAQFIRDKVYHFSLY